MSAGEDPVSMAREVSKEIQELLHESWSRVIDLFRRMDVDENGSISRDEFADGLAELGFAFSDEAELAAVFDQYDPDGSGAVTFEEMNTKLRAAARNEVGPPVEMEEEPTLTAKEERVIPRVVKGMGDALMLSKELRLQLQRSWSRVIDLFRKMDTDFSGSITCSEFMRALKKLGACEPFRIRKELRPSRACK